jgi:cellobiose phosphorylase
MAGNAGNALDYYLRINPSAREEISDVHRCEPYVYAQMIAGPDAPTHGEAKNAWLTGTAAWNYVAATQWLVGIRPELDGLRIDPHLPADGGTIRVTRRFRGSTYRIAIHPAADGADATVSRLVVDGRDVAGNLAPLPGAPRTVVEVEAWRGAPVEAAP